MWWFHLSFFFFFSIENFRYWCCQGNNFVRQIFKQTFHYWKKRKSLMSRLFSVFFRRKVLKYRNKLFFVSTHKVPLVLLWILDFAICLSFPSLSHCHPGRSLYPNIFPYSNSAAIHVLFRVIIIAEKSIVQTNFTKINNWMKAIFHSKL